MLGRYMISRRNRVGDWERAQIAAACFAITTSEPDCQEPARASNDPDSRGEPRRCRSLSESKGLPLDEEA